jgi:hypothetical protein
MLVDVFEVESSSARQNDWVIHAVSDSLRPVEALGEPKQATPGKENGYQHLSDARAWPVQAESRWDFSNANSKALRVTLVSTGPEQIFTATGIGYSTSQRVPCLLRRRSAPSTRFTSVFDLSGPGALVKSARWDDAGKKVVVETSAGTREFAATR